MVKLLRRCGKLRSGKLRSSRSPALERGRLRARQRIAGDTRANPLRLRERAVSQGSVWSAALLSASLLTACATTPEPKIETQIVKVEVVRPCIPKTLDLSPVFPDSDEALKKTAGPDDMLQLLAAGRLLRVQTMKEWAVTLRACQ